MNNRGNKTFESDPPKSIYALPIAEIYRSLSTGPSGLTQTEADERLKRFGRNAIREVRRKPLYLKFFANFTHLMAILLWAGGILAFIGHLPQLGWAIWAVIVIKAVFLFWQEFKAERAMEAPANAWIFTPKMGVRRTTRCLHWSTPPGCRGWRKFRPCRQ